jgi:hypothetical protein
MTLSRNWKRFNSEIILLSESQLLKELHKELKGANRISYLKRLFTRYSRLRSIRELRKLLQKGEAPKR